MPKLPVLKPKQVLKRFEKLGFVIDRQSGSHLILYHPKTKKRAVIPLHLTDLKKGTLSAIIRESGVNKEDFL
ncbi:MAG: type II toxin-antitoxin system HicA family toxin [Patescibacteria group bacterium]